MPQGDLLERVERMMETQALVQDRLVEIASDLTEGLQRMEAVLRQILAALTKD